MKKVLFALVLIASFFKVQAQQSLTAVSLLRPGSASTFLTTNGSGQVVWGNAASVLTAGTGISISGNQIVNTAPNQTVSITGGGITSVTGTYPNFTISSTEADGSTTNEAQTLSASGTTSPVINLTAANGAGGGSVTFTAGSGITLGHSANNITITAASFTGSLSFFKTVMASASATVAVTGFTPTITNSIVVVDGTTFEWGSGNDVTVSGTTLTFSRTLEVGMKVLVIKVH
jgi:hypothetical protein